MNIKKSDWSMIVEAQNQGLMVSMTGIVERTRTQTNNELSRYFRNQLPDYTGSFSEEEADDLLSSLNKFLAEHRINKPPLIFPYSGGTNVYLVPVTDNIQVKVSTFDEEYSEGDEQKHVLVDFFTINDHAATNDVDQLLSFVKKTVLRRN